MSSIETFYKTSLTISKGRNETEKYILGLFLLWPLAALFQAIKYYRSSWSKNIIWLFFIFTGFTFVIIGSGADASRYRDSLTMMANSEYNLSMLFSSYFSENSSTLDIGQGIVTYFVSLFTADYRFLFALFAVFMGYFLSRIIWYLIDMTRDRIGLFAGLILICYSLIVGIWDIGGVRWNISAVIFVYGILIYFFENKKLAYLIIVSTIFVHWSFPLAIGVFLIYKLLGNRTYAYFALFLVSFFIAQFDLEIIRNLFYAYAPNPVLESRGSYLSEFYVNSLSQNSESLAWYIKGHFFALKWFVFAFVVYIFIAGRQVLSKNPPIYSLFNFGLLFYGFFNILSGIPSVGRFIAIGNLILLGVLFLIIQENHIRYPNWLKLLSVPVLLLFIIVRIRIGLDFTGLWTLIGNPVIALFVENDIALIDIIKDIL